MLITSDPITLAAGQTFTLAAPIAPLQGQRWGVLLENRSGLLLQVTTPEGTKWLGPYMCDVFGSNTPFDTPNVTVKTSSPPTPFPPGAGQSYLLATWGQYPSDFGQDAYPAQLTIVGSLGSIPITAVATRDLNASPLTITGMGVWLSLIVNIVAVGANQQLQLTWASNPLGGPLLQNVFDVMYVSSTGNVLSQLVPVRSDSLTFSTLGGGTMSLDVSGSLRDATRGLVTQLDQNSLFDWNGVVLPAGGTSNILRDYTGPARVTFAPGVNTTSIIIEDLDHTGAVVGRAFHAVSLTNAVELWLSPYRHRVTVTTAAGDTVNGAIIPEW